MVYPCDLCDKVFNYPVILEIHYRSHTGEKPYQCKLCKKSFSHEAHVFVHVRNHFQQENYLPKSPYSPESALDHTEVYEDEREDKACEEDSFPNENSSLIQKKQQSRIDSREIFAKVCDSNFHRQKAEYVCGSSNVAFLQQSDLKDHTEPYIDERKDKASFPNENNLVDNFPTYICIICNEEFSRECNLKSHSKIHTQKAQYLCGSSNGTFFQESALEQHTEPYIDERKDLACLEASFPHENNLDNFPTYRCIICSEVFSRECNLKSHRRVHRRKEQYVSKLDHKESFQKSNLKIHTEMKKDIKHDVCAIEVLSNENNLDNHNIAPKQDEEIFTCSEISLKECDSYHEDCVQKDPKPLSDKCGETLEKKSKLCFREKEKSFTCDTRGKVFSNKRNLKTHEPTHTKDGSFKCDTCGEEFLKKSKLTAHSRVHRKKKPLTCEVCGKVCSKKSLLIVHKRIHAKERRFVCGTCGKSFVRRCHLKVHYRVHTKEKPHKCEVCGRSFSQITILKVHYRVHTEEKPFECDICGKAFRQVSNLKQHLRNTH